MLQEDLALGVKRRCIIIYFLVSLVISLKSKLHYIPKYNRILIINIIKLIYLFAF